MVARGISETVGDGLDRDDLRTWTMKLRVFDLLDRATADLEGE